MINVLMCGNHPSNKGGMTSVIQQILNHNWNDDQISIAFIPTFIPGGLIKKSVFFGISYLRITGRLLFNRPDLVYMHMSYKGSFTRKYLLHRLCMNFNVPFIIHLHGSEFKKWYHEVDYRKKKKIRELLNEAHSFIVLGEKWNITIKEIEPKTNTLVISNTVKLPSEVAKWNNPVKVLFLGVLIKRKGVSDLLHASQILKNKIGNEFFKIIIAGSGEEEDKLIKEANSLRINDVVDFVGWTDGKKKDELLRTSQILVLPSYNEGLPIAVLEALSCGMPIVATSVGDIPSAVCDGENGYLIEPGDIEQLAFSMEKIICDRDMWEEMSRESRAKALREYSEDIFFEKLSVLFRGVNGSNEK